MAEPSLVSVTFDLCSLCLGGAGGECHVPGCVFWMCPAPTAQQADWIRNKLYVEIVAANRDAFPGAEEWDG